MELNVSLILSNFLGRNLIIPEDRLYDASEGLWIRKMDDGRLAVGITEPTVIMGGTVREVEILVEDNSCVTRGETVILALTGKLRYMASPVSGKLTCSEDLGSLPGKIVQDPYGTPVFYVSPDQDESDLLVDPAGYLEALKDSDGSRNPGGHKGGASPTCKAVYMALGEQNIKK